MINLQKHQFLIILLPIYEDLGDKHQALAVYGQALLLSREFKDKGGEATILNNIGGIHNHLGDKQRALEFYNQSLSISKKIEDKSIYRTLSPQTFCRYS